VHQESFPSGFTLTEAAIESKLQKVPPDSHYD